MRRRKPDADDRIGAIYGRNFNGVQISVLDIGKVFAAGRAAIAANGDDAAILAAIAPVVATIRKN